MAERRMAHDCPMASTYATVDMTNYCGHPSHGYEDCSHHCGYVSEGADLLDHERYEHRPCPDCGGGKDRSPEWLEIHSVSHRLDCPRLQPDYIYPDREGDGDA